MKAGIHPAYKVSTVTCSCGNTFETGSVKEDIRIEVCSECHPFYTGRQKFAQADGRVDRFNKKYGLKEEGREEEEEEVFHNTRQVQCAGRVFLFGVENRHI